MLNNVGSPLTILHASHSTLCKFVPPELAHSIIRQAESFNPASYAQWLEDGANSVITLQDSLYPPQLLQLPTPPVLLFVKGNTSLLSSQSVAVVGSRNATAQGLRNAEAFATSLSESGLCIVSGLAAGIDSAAHTGGLSARSSSIAVVGTGLDRVYPASNQSLAHRLAEFGVLISEFPLGTPPRAGNFPRRNRIIAALSLGCLVVEASMNSGSLITASISNDLGRDVFAIPGSIHSPNSKGCHFLIKNGAKLVDCVDDVLSEFSLSTFISTSTVSTNPDELLTCLGFDPVSFDDLLSITGLTAGKLSAILTELELSGFIVCLPGGNYQRLS